MRLIDIDKLVSDYKGKNKNLHNVTWFELTDYEVKAIPIEWIERKLAEHWYVDYDIRELLDDWEKENEKDI